MSIINASEALNAIKAAPETILTLVKKPGDKTYTGGVKYLTAQWNIAGKTLGWFSADNIKITKGMPDIIPPVPHKNDIDKRTYENMRLQIQTSVANAGDFGQFLNLLDPVWTKLVATLSVKGGLIGLSDRKTHCIVQTKTSLKNEENPGALIEDPIIRFKISFAKFPGTFKPESLANQPKTQFFDFKKPYTDEEGKPQFRQATIKDPVTGKEVLVDESNLHLFLTRNSIIRRGRFMMTSVSISQSYVSFAMEAGRLVIESAPPTVFSDDDFSDILGAPTQSTTNAPTAGGQPDPLSDQDISNIINST